MSLPVVRLADVRPADILALAREEQSRAREIIVGLPPCPIALSRATTLLGSFSVGAEGPVIRISRYLVDEEQVRDTARHELAHLAAHALNGHVGHGPHWQTWARYLGCVPLPCTPVGVDPEVVRRRERYVVMCRRCGWTTTRQRRSRLVRYPRFYACAHCRGPLTVDTLRSDA